MPIVEKVEATDGKYYNFIVLQPMDDADHPPTVKDTARGLVPGQETNVPYKAEPKLSDEQEVEVEKAPTAADVPVATDVPEAAEFPDLPELPRQQVPLQDDVPRTTRRSRRTEVPPRDSIQLRSRTVHFK